MAQPYWRAESRAGRQQPRTCPVLNTLPGNAVSRVVERFAKQYVSRPTPGK